jgi:glycosyltransferase involved in cell wall biosynthesis
VHWDRRLEPGEVAAAFDASLALLLPSASEGLPRIGVESFLRGRGVVGTRAGGIPDLVEDGASGLLVDLGDIEALARAIERVLTEDGLAARLGGAAAAAAERWVSTPAEYADRVLAVVKAVLV